MRSAKLKITYADDVKRVFVEIESFNPLKVIFKGDIEHLLDGAENLQIQYFEEGMLIKKIIEVRDIQDNSIIFKDIETEKEDINRKEFRADCKGVSNVKKINSTELSKYQRIVDEQNNEEKNSIVSKIREIVASSTDEQRNFVLMFLIELNEKLDRLINIVANTSVDDELVRVKLIDISGGGVCFFSESKEFDVEECIYLRIEIKELFHQIKCSAVGRVIKIEQTGKGYFYGIQFEYLDIDFREAIIKYVLEKERFLVREYKLK